MNYTATTSDSMDPMLSGNRFSDADIMKLRETAHEVDKSALLIKNNIQKLVWSICEDIRNGALCVIQKRFSSKISATATEKNDLLSDFNSQLLSNIENIITPETVQIKLLMVSPGSPDQVSDEINVMVQQMIRILSLIMHSNIEEKCSPVIIQELKQRINVPLTTYISIITQKLVMTMCKKKNIYVWNICNIENRKVFYETLLGYIRQVIQDRLFASDVSNFIKVQLQNASQKADAALVSNNEKPVARNQAVSTISRPFITNIQLAAHGFPSNVVPATPTETPEMMFSPMAKIEPEIAHTEDLSLLTQLQDDKKEDVKKEPSALIEQKIQPLKTEELPKVDETKKEEEEETEQLVIPEKTSNDCNIQADIEAILSTPKEEEKPKDDVIENVAVVDDTPAVVPNACEQKTENKETEEIKNETKEVEEEVLEVALPEEPVVDTNSEITETLTNETKESPIVATIDEDDKTISAPEISVPIVIQEKIEQQQQKDEKDKSSDVTTTTEVVEIELQESEDEKDKPKAVIEQPKSDPSTPVNEIESQHFMKDNLDIHMAVPTSPPTLVTSAPNLETQRVKMIDLAESPESAKTKIRIPMVPVSAVSSYGSSSNLISPRSPHIRTISSLMDTFSRSTYTKHPNVMQKIEEVATKHYNDPSSMLHALVSGLKEVTVPDDKHSS